MYKHANRESKRIIMIEIMPGHKARKKTVWAEVKYTYTGIHYDLRHITYINVKHSAIN